MDFLFVSTAFAQAAGGAAASTPSVIDLLILPMGFLFIMYFFMIRPQQKRARDHASLVGGLKPGDEVVTSGGIIGRVRSVADAFVTIEISSNTQVKVLKPNVTGLTKSLEAPAKEK